MIKTCHNGCAFLPFSQDIVTTTVAVTFHLQSNSILCNICVHATIRIHTWYRYEHEKM